MPTSKLSALTGTRFTVFDRRALAEELALRGHPEGRPIAAEHVEAPDTMSPLAPELRAEAAKETLVDAGRRPVPGREHGEVSWCSRSLRSRRDHADEMHPLNRADVGLRVRRRLPERDVVVVLDVEVRVKSV